ncbi:hypothetical protein FA143_33685 [Pseudomonas aeruginosa]|uniref:Pathogenesis-related protein n=14 Tax=Pseudomonas aeruginosa TaxID=287 RepID=Q7WZ22_PSEAI|nr:pathogenesis-related protein [Pseudomonas aeruginosa PA14]ABJ10142.1 hypothetical protein PA14_51610 [Pseudomonas aeruginosa UCBPP-PA14]ALS10951.1 hypothetical protein AOU28_04785 [Pseudomonas aeruginosa]EKA41424.1 hypothetical protein PACI27_4225 [Pseudomonas aeruginosa CI27]KKJ53288.1 hypothetical protein T648_08880 [Pseudomonas aeruginosa MRSN 317]OFM77285.1 hypothetical protein HMPREF2670_02530 [Pseudomonas sp. HMSC072F09]OHO99457.1 hypothetical protein HMPREF2581_03845 [Pseudomonas sp
MLYFSCSMKMGGWVGYRYFSLFSLIALIYGCVGGGGGSDEIGQHCFEREQKLSGVNDNEEGSVRLNRLNCDPIEGRVLESEKLIRKPPNELGIH